MLLILLQFGNPLDFCVELIHDFPEVFEDSGRSHPDVLGFDDFVFLEIGEHPLVFELVSSYLSFFGISDDGAKLL